MKRWVAETKLHRGRLNEGQKEAVQDRPLHQGPGGRSAGLCRHRQDHDAQPAALPGREAGLPRDRARAIGLGGTHAGAGSRHRERDPATLHRSPYRHRGRQRHRQGRAQPAIRLPEYAPGRRRKLARVDRTDARSAQDRDDVARRARRSRRRREAIGRRGSGHALRAVATDRDADGSDGGRSCASATPN